MLDLKLIREQPDYVKQQLARFAVEPALVDQVLAFDEARRQQLRKVEDLKAQRNAVSKAISKMAPGPEREAQIAAMRAVGAEIAALDKDVAAIEEGQRNAMLELRNLPHPDVPDGADDSANPVIYQEGEERTLSFAAQPHWELAEQLGMIHFEQGVKLAGSRFYVLRGLGARLQRATIQWLLDLHLRQGYTEVYTPFVVKEQVLWASGQLPKFRDNLYRDEESGLWLVPTAEVPLTSLYSDDILNADQLPIYHVAYTPCFRKEQLSAGRDVRGIKRGHQFDKVEMYMFETPERSYAALEKLRSDAEECARLLGLPFRTKLLCTGDIGFGSAKTYDIEVWAPGQGEWLEVSSCSNVEAFQARRANLRYRPEPGAKPEFLHTLNGSGLGLPRTIIAIMENYQQADGSILVPEVLRPYMGGVEVIR
ncbi:serine--tRNA ligase [Candidatus Viridilinea mediisalina]|uniref:Serine--tRNA ligase n=1 Tax=Candidatus Viridilinea mediisalina TaxID=2024553 RepID=A0A2A6RPX3_9CHLR|nr:serine--tRNA ligase [Candidatus Viridilinea mediisalina]PDW04983.1 serine--tRNA ligase [Candidatus Viridilinea mediisalina]